jgi:hypothetical protein
LICRTKPSASDLEDLPGEVIARVESSSTASIDAGWTGAEIKQCCDIALALDCTLKEASGFVVPVSRSAADQLERLRKAAEGRFLSASRLGVYSREHSEPTTTTNDREQLAMAEDDEAMPSRKIAAGFLCRRRQSTSGRYPGTVARD